MQFWSSLKNLLVLIYFKLHSKSCDYLYLHAAREFYSVKLIRRNLYSLFSHVKKSLYSQSEWRTAVSHVDVKPVNDSISAFASQSESCIVYIPIAFHIWRLFSRRLLQIFPAKGTKTPDLCRLVATQTSLHSIKKTRTH